MVPVVAASCGEMALFQMQSRLLELGCVTVADKLLQVIVVVRKAGGSAPGVGLATLLKRRRTVRKSGLPW